MPRPLEPNQRFPVVLECDQDKPLGQQPTFVFRTTSRREWRQLAEEVKAEHPGDIHAQAEAFCKRLLVDWTNMTRDGQPVPFDAAELDSIVENQDLLELFDRLSFSPRDKKKSASQP